jgi:hypothetical protein
MADLERTQLRADIRAHLQSYGSRNWGVLRRRYSSVPPATWWRSIAREKARIGTQHLVFQGQQNRAAGTTGAANCNAQAGDASTSTPGPTGEAFDFLAAFRGLFADAIKLREHALHVDGRVRNPAVLDRAIRIRLKLLRQGLDLERQIFSARAQRAFFEGLVAEIAAEAPALQKRLINRLRGFQQSVCGRGLSETRSEVEVAR